MIEINLLPSIDKRRPSRSRTSVRAPSLPAFRGEPWTAGVGAALVLVLLSIGLVWWRTDARATQLTQTIDRAVQDSTQLSSTIALLDALSARQDTINQRITIIRSIDERRYVWPHILDEVGRAVPAFTWLAKVTSIEAVADSTGVVAPPAMTIEGSAGSTMALTRFMKNLEESPFIRDVSLVTTEQVIEDGRALQRFTLEARYEAPDPTLLETVPLVGAE